MSIDDHIHAGLKVPEIYFETRSQRYWYRSGKGEYIPLGIDGMADKLKRYGFSTKRTHTSMSSAHEYLDDIRETNNVGWVGALAGYKKGKHVIAGRNYLVDSEPTIIQPDKNCDWSDLKYMIDNMFTLRKEKHFLYAWIKYSYEALRDQTQRPGPCLTITGPHNCGKTLFLYVLERILGGRVGSQKQYMDGDTSFNADLIGTELLKIDDENSSKKMNDRRQLGQMIKNICVAGHQRVHSKGRDAFNVRLFWRLVICTNEGDTDLNVLPPLVDGIRDKMLCLRVERPEVFPGPNKPDLRREHMENQVPGLLYYLMNWKVPEYVKGHRFGVRDYQNEFVDHSLWSVSDEAQMVDVIKEWKPWQDEDKWVGTAIDFKNQMLEYDSNKMIARELLGWKGAAGVLLNNLCDLQDSHFTRRREGSNTWKYTIRKFTDKDYDTKIPEDN